MSQLAFPTLFIFFPFPFESFEEKIFIVCPEFGRMLFVFVCVHYALFTSPYRGTSWDAAAIPRQRVSRPRHPPQEVVRTESCSREKGEQVEKSMPRPLSFLSLTFTARRSLSRSYLCRHQISSMLSRFSMCF